MRFAFAACLLVVACSSESTVPRAAVDGGADAPDVATNSNAIKLRMDVTVPAGKEIFRCQLFQLPTSPDGEIFISGTSHEYTPGSHHYLVFRTSLTAIEPGLDKPFDCAEGGGVMEKYAQGFVFGGQTPKDTRTFPDGAAIPLKSGEIVVLQSHYINATPGDLAATVNVQLNMIPKAEVKNRAGVMRLYDPYIHIAPKSTATAQMRCPIKKDITVVQMMPHMHERGVKETAWIDPPGARATDPVLVNEDWQHPKEFAGQIAVKAGSSFRYQCAYRNEEDRIVNQGQSATDEMCMLTAFYYPAMAAEDEFCFRDAEWMGAGTASCADTTTCIQKCPPGGQPRPAPGLTGVDVSPCWQQCVVNSCPNASGPFLKQISCIGANCSAECAAGDCASCALSKCKDETIACQSLACGD
jgi:hypothetical protein